MTHAYSDKYINDAANNMGEMLDYVENICDMELEEFFHMFIMSGYAKQFEKGVPSIVIGMSGIELAWEVIHHFDEEAELPEQHVEYKTLSAYWIGTMLAYFQWKTCIPFQEIIEYITFEDLKKLYDTLRNRPKEEFADIICAVIQRDKTSTKLHKIRTACGLSQRQLADKSNVNIRNIQQYEQRVKDINKAASGNLAALADVMGCRIEDLLET